MTGNPPATDTLPPPRQGPYPGPFEESALHADRIRWGQPPVCLDVPLVLCVQALAVISSDPRQYALKLSEAMTGQPLQLQGYSPAYDALLQVAPAAALTPEAIAKGHELVSLTGHRHQRRGGGVAGPKGGGIRQQGSGS
jgi:hypothetical protein